MFFEYTKDGWSNNRYTVENKSGTGFYKTLPGSVYLSCYGFLRFLSTNEKGELSVLEFDESKLTQEDRIEIAEYMANKWKEWAKYKYDKT